MNGMKSMRHEQRVKELSKALHLLIEYQEEEYQSLALDIHDEVGQSLTSVLLLIKMLQDEKDPSRIKDALKNLEEIVSHSIADVRRIARVLRPAELEANGLIPSLERLSENSQEHTGMINHFRYNGGRTVFSHYEELHIYRILQEALTNAYLHGKAEHCHIIISCVGNDFVLSFKDDGCGFDTEHVKKGIGLLGMTERANMIGGKLRIGSKPGRGTHILLTCRMKTQEE